MDEKEIVNLQRKLKANTNIIFSRRKGRALGGSHQRFFRGPVLTIQGRVLVEEKEEKKWSEEEVQLSKCHHGNKAPV